MSLSFSEQIKNWRNKTTQRMELVFQESIQELGKQANKQRSRGGNMPVDTSFLMNSLTAAINDAPKGQGTAPAGYAGKRWDNTDFLLVTNRAKIGDRVTIGYTANYAIYMEARYKFLRLAAQDWPQIVKRVTRRVDKRVSENAQRNN